MEHIDKKLFVNSLYQGIIYSGLIATYSQISKQFFKMKTPEIKLDATDIGKLTALVTAADVTFDYLVKAAIIPATIMA
jgi:hypothetical protein